MTRAYAPQTTSPELEPAIDATAPTTTGWGNQDAVASLDPATFGAAPTTCSADGGAWYDQLLASPQATARALLFGPYLGDLDGFRARMDEASALAAADLGSENPDRAAAAAGLPDALLVAEMSLGIPGVLGSTEWAALAAGLDDPQRADATAAFVDAFFGPAAPVVLSDVQAHRAESAATEEEPGFLSQWADAIGSEGLDAVIDPTGGIDRMHARDELSSRFQIVDEDSTNAAPNALTQDEYDEVVDLYSDVRLGRTSLGIDTEGMDPEAAEAFKAGTMDDIGDLMQTEAGRQVVGDLAEADPEFRRTWITPASDPMKPETKEAWKLGKPASEGKSWVQYSPETSVDQESGLAWDDIRSDVVLMHELTHAWYASEGTEKIDAVKAEDDPTKRDRTPDWQNEKTDPRTRKLEYQAVGLGQWSESAVSENAYRAERNAMEGQPGALEGDGELAQRDSYWTKTADEEAMTPF